MAQTLSGGEIIVLDSGGYGVATIDKSVSIISRRRVRGVSAFTGNAININTASLTVVLEGLTLNGTGRRMEKAGVYLQPSEYRSCRYHRLG